MSKIKRFSGKALTVLLSLIMLLSLLAPAVLAESDDPVTLAAWTLTGALDTNSGTQATDGLMKDKSNLSSTATYSGFTGGNGTVYYNNWTVGGYWEITTSTAGYEDLELKFASYGSGTGPKNFAAYISVNGGSFVKVEGSDYSLITTATTGTAQNITISLPPGAEDAAELRIRLQVENNVSINDGTLAGTGTSRIGSVTLTSGQGGEGDGGGDTNPVVTIAAARAQGTGSVSVEGVVTRAIQSSGTNTTNCTLYIQDATGGIAVYVSGITLSIFNIGEKVKVTGALGVNSGVLQIQPASVAAIEVLPDPLAPMTPETISIGQLNSLAYEGRLVKIEGVRLFAIATNSNHTIVDTTDGASTTMRCTAGTTLPDDFAADNIIDVIGIAANYNGTAQLMVSKFNDITHAGGTTIAQANNTPTGQTVTIRGQATYLYANNSMMVQDGTGENDGICVYMSGANFSSYIGKIVTVTGNRADFNNLKEVVPANINDVIIADDEAAFITAPTEITVAELAAGKYVGSWVKVKDVQLTSRNAATNAQNHTISQNGAAVTLRAALSTAIAEGDWLTITGCGYMFDTPQLFCVAAGIAPGEAPPITGDRETIAEWISPTVSDEIAATGGEYATASNLKIVDTASTVLNWANAAINRAGGFDNKAGVAYWLFSTSSADFMSIRVDFSMRSSGTGPRDFRVQYSTDGDNWSDANSPEIRVGNALGINDPLSQFSKTLPSGANKAETLYIRLLLDTNISANSGSIASGGTNSINNIIITGEFVLTENQLSSPSSDTPPGAVPIGKEITFTPDARDAAVPDYAIMVSDDSGATWVEASGGVFTIATLPLTIQVKATAPDMADSRVNTYSYTQAKLPQVTASRNSGAVNPSTTIRLDCAVGDSTIKYQINGDGIQDYEGPLTLDEALFIGEPETVTIMAWAVKDGYIDSDDAIFNYTIAATGGERVYFGQIHSHTKLSDGSGEVEEAYRYARDVAGLDFFAVTDHSNSLGEQASQNGDAPASINLNTYNSDNANWLRGQNAAAAAYREGEFISFYGYEMTWSGGPGHMNTFNTGGFVSRNNAALNVKSNDAGMRAYYELLSRTPDSITMFNHPGTTFGNFSNFAYYDPVIDQRITLLEVGNGEGAIGSGGYFPSYEQYTMALDKGWHVAPVNSQDNHLGRWGNSNTARVAIWTNDFTMEGVYQALRDMRVYSTEVADLEIVYSVNGQPLGTILDVVPTAAEFTAEIVNPTAGNYVKSVCLVTNGGVEILRDTPNAQNYDYSKTINNPAAGYYYLRVIVSTPQGDRIAVTAPVWLGASKSAGFVEVIKSSLMPVSGEELTISSTLFNNDRQSATLQSLIYTDNKGDIIYRDDDLNLLIATAGEVTHKMTYTPDQAGDVTIHVTALMAFTDGTSKSFSYDISYMVRDPDELVYIGVDASHYNEYVDGNYKDNMVNFAAIAADYGVRVEVLWTSEALIAATANPKYKAMILTAPSRRVDPAAMNPTTSQLYGKHRSYSQDELDAFAAFSQRGGTVVISGWSNAYESYVYTREMPLDEHMAAQQNKVLAAIGSTLRLSDDAATDRLQWSSATDPYRLYMTDANESYNWESPLLTGADKSQIFSQYGGSTIYTVDAANSGDWNSAPSVSVPESVIPAVMLSIEGESVNRETYPPDTNYRTDYTKYNDRYMLLASESVDHGDGNVSLVIAAGGAFMSNFEVKIEMDNASSLQYSNYNLALNLIKSIVTPPVITDIADVKEMAEGAIVTIEGIATTNVYSGDSAANTGFFDCIYVQDATGGINLFPVSSGVLEGQRIRVTGTVSSYQGEIQIAVRKLDVIDPEINNIAPAEVSTAAAMNPANTGMLLKTSGVVSDVITVGGMISQFTITDVSGVGALIYINAYITGAVDLSFIEDGATVSVIGLGSIGENQTSGDPLPRVRVRDRSEILLISEPPVIVDPVLVSATPSARVDKLSGNQNRLYITVVELFSDGSTNTIEWNGLISNNAAGTYQVGPYRVYVDTKGNDQIRACYIVN